MKNIFNKPKQAGTKDPTAPTYEGKKQNVNVLELEKGRRGALVSAKAEDLSSGKIITTTETGTGTLGREFIEHGAGDMLAVVKVKPGEEGVDVGLFSDRNNNSIWAAVIERNTEGQLTVGAVTRAAPGENIIIGRTDSAYTEETGVRKLNLPDIEIESGGSLVSRSHVTVGVPEARSIGCSVRDLSTNGGVSVASTNAQYLMEA